MKSASTLLKRMLQKCIKRSEPLWQTKYVKKQEEGNELPHIVQTAQKQTTKVEY